MRQLVLAHDVIEHNFQRPRRRDGRRHLQHHRNQHHRQTPAIRLDQTPNQRKQTWPSLRPPRQTRHQSPRPASVLSTQQSMLVRGSCNQHCSATNASLAVPKVDCDRQIPVLASARWRADQGQDFATPSPSHPRGPRLRPRSPPSNQIQAQARAFSPSGRTSPLDPGLDAGSQKGGLHEDVSHQGHPKRGHCRPRRHRQNATGVVVALHRGNDAALGKSCGRHHHHGLGRRRNRQKNFDSNRARLRRMAVHALLRRQSENQSHRSARLFHVHQRSESLAHRRRCRADHRRRSRRRASHHRKSLGLLHRVRHSARVCPHMDGSRTVQLRARDGIAASRYLAATLSLCSCRSAPSAASAASSISSA